MAQIKRSKDDLHITISPYIKLKMKQLIDDCVFTSEADLTSTALIEFLMRFDCEQERSLVIEVLMEMLAIPEGKIAYEKVMENRKGYSNNGKNKPQSTNDDRNLIIFD